MYFPGLCCQARDSEGEESSCGQFQKGTQHGDREDTWSELPAGILVWDFYSFIGLCQIW